MTTNPAKTCIPKNLRTRNCHRKFIKNLLAEKRKENMQTKQPRFKLPLNNMCIETKTHSFFNKIEYLLLDK